MQSYVTVGSNKNKLLNLKSIRSVRSFSIVDVAILNRFHLFGISNETLKCKRFN